ncbi:MAG TPA: hypothetical protein VGE74_23315 [Gemmata sp.]
MTIHGITCSVDFADRLASGIDRWAAGLASLCVVTTPDDSATLALCVDRPGVRVHMTDAFTRDGAAFNKGAALSEAVDAGKVPMGDWVLAFDADIIPPADWADRIANARPVAGTLYGATRTLCDGLADADAATQRVDDADVAGFFMLFHGRDVNAAHRPLFDSCWRHAGNYDTRFMHRWAGGGSGDRQILPLLVAHQGPVRENWWGRGNAVAMRRMEEERNRRGGSYEHERI